MDLLLATLLAVLLGTLPMAVFAVLLTWFDRFEREPFGLLFAVFLWGFLFASAAAFVLNTLFGMGILMLTGSGNFAWGTTAIFFGPLVEETVKGLGLLLVFLFFRREIDSILDGIVYGGLVGFGFAAAENFLYVFSGYNAGGMILSLEVAFARLISIPFLHAMLTAIIGMGLAYASIGRSRYRLAAPFLAYAFAVCFHSFHNLLAVLGISFLVFASFIMDWSGFIGMILLLFYLMRKEAKTLRRYLEEEVSLGTITEDHCSMVSSMSSQAARKTGIQVDFSGRRKRLNDICSRLAYEKHDLEVHGASAGTQDRIAQLRREAAMLSKRGE